MKNKFLRIGAVILICCSFFLVACASTGDPGGTEIDPSIKDTAENAQDIYNTKDNVTIYKDKNGNNNNGKGADVFGDALVFVDPGSNALFTDHFTNTDKQFGVLVDRQIDYLAEILSQTLGDFYIKDKTTSGFAHSNNYTFLTAPSVEGNTKMYDSTAVVNKIDVADYNYLTAVAKIISDASLPKVSYNDGTNDQTEQYLNFTKAIYGGLKRVPVNSNLVFTGATDNGVQTSYNYDNRWKFIDTYSIDISGATTTPTYLIETLKNDLKMQIASALSGVKLSDGYNAINLATETYNEMLTQIDHLGFTATDTQNVVNTILQGVVGKTASDADENLYKQIISASGAVISSPDVNDAYRDYKAYSTVLTNIVNKAVETTYLAGKTTDEESGIEVDVYEKIFIGFPRINILNVDIKFLLDAEDTTTNEGEDGGTQMGDADYTIPNVDPSEFENQKTTLDEKFDKNMKIVGVLLMPNEVTGDRTMARKENGEWVYESDGTTVAKKEFEVNGFLMTSMEVSLLCETGSYASIQANFLVHTPTHTMTASTDVMEVGSVKPQVDENNFSYSTNFMDAQTLVMSEEDVVVTSTSGEEGTVESFRIGGYNGVSLDKTGAFKLGEQVVSNGKGVVSANGKYITYQLNTNLYKYIGVSDINGSEGTTLPGYLLDLANYAGDNYVQADFSVLSVNDDDFNRNVNFNLLYLMAYTY